LIIGIASASFHDNGCGFNPVSFGFERDFAGVAMPMAVFAGVLELDGKPGQSIRRSCVS
jgi:hypothetical protein